MAANSSTPAELNLSVFRLAVPTTQTVDFEKLFGGKITVSAPAADVPAANPANSNEKPTGAMLRSATARRDEVRQALDGGNLLAAAQLIVGTRSEAGKSITQCASGAGAGPIAEAEGSITASGGLQQDLASSGAWDAQHAQQGLVSVGVGGYFSWFQGLLRTVEQAPADVLAQVRFIWNTPVCTRNARSPFVDSSFHWEAVMLALALGISLRNLACDRLTAAQTSSSAEFSAAAPSVAGLLQRAAGVFAHCRDAVLVNWTARPEKTLPEATEGLYSALEYLCLAEAQTVTVRKAQISGMASSSVAKLMAGAADLFESSRLAFMQLPGVNIKRPLESLVKSDLVVYVGLNVSLWKAAAHIETLKSEFAAQHMGLSVAHGRAAEALVPKLSSSKQPPGIEKFLLKYEKMRQEFVDEHQKVDRENSTIYYDIVPESPPEPQPRIMAKRTNFEPPVQHITIELAASDGTSCCVM